MIRKIVTYILILTMSTSGWAGTATKSNKEGKTCNTGMSEEMSAEDMIARISKFSESIENVRSHIDRSQFDLGALLEKLDYEADKIINFVKNDIYFEQYPGLLRGAQGTLMSRAGNALDQSVLLAGLLNDAGFEARIARGLLDEASASVLIKQMGTKRISQPQAGDIEKMKAAMSSMLQELSGISREVADKQASELFKERDVTESPIYAQAITETDGLLTRLKAEGFFKDTEKSDKALNEEAREYFWVQWREGPTKPWAEVDVALSTETAFRRPDITRTFSKKIPSEFQHGFRVEVSLDRDFGGKSNHTLLARTDNLATANLLGSPISISMIPNGFSKQEDYGDLKEGLKRTTLWTPVIDKVPGKLAFDLQGNVVDTMAATSAGAALFQTVGNKFSTAIESTGDRDNKGPVAQLTHLWIDQITTSPGGKETRYRTDLLSKSMTSPDAGELTPPQLELEMKGILSSSHSLMLAVGRYPDAYVLDKFIERIWHTSQVVLKQKDSANLDWSKIDTASIGQLDFFSMSDLGLDKRKGLSYRSGPSIFALSHVMLPKGKLRVISNIIFSPKRSLINSGGRIVLDPQNNVFAGIWESFIEGGLLKSGPGTHFSAAAMLRKAVLTGEDFNVLTPERKSLQGHFRVSDSTKYWIDQDIGKGYAIAVPTKQLEEGSMRSVWWRVNPESGETLAMMQGGYGVEVTAKVVLLAAIVGGVVGSIIMAACTIVIKKSTGKITGSQGLQCFVCGLFAGAAASLSIILAAESAAAIASTSNAMIAAAMVGIIASTCPAAMVVLE